MYMCSFMYYPKFHESVYPGRLLTHLSIISTLNFNGVHVQLSMATFHEGVHRLNGTSDKELFSTIRCSPVCLAVNMKYRFLTKFWFTYYLFYCCYTFQ